MLSEFEEVDGSEGSGQQRDDSTAAATGCSRRVACVNGELRRCQDGQWTLVARCAQTQFCSVELQRCTECEPIRDTVCDGLRLLRCRHDGDGFELLQDCESIGGLCDVALSPEACLECRATDRRCDGDVLMRCVNGRFGDGEPCEAGPCQVVDGRSDYCAECSHPKREACGVDERVVCSDTYRFESLGRCPNGCVVAGDATTCL